MRLLQKVLIIVILSVSPLTTVFAEGEKTASIQVDGLSCPFCAYGLEKNLKKVKGIEVVRIDMKAGKATVVLQPDAHVDDQSLREAVKNAGFTARDITRN